jgi:uncharacterized iron-regulated membrane protein
MKLQILFRKVHHWGSIVVAIPVVIIIVTGLFLQLKKDVNWIQPPTERGVSTTMPQASFEDMFAAAMSVDEAGIKSWQDLDRVDIKPNKGVVKFIATSNWEVQVDTSTAEVLSYSFRRSDVIEAIHDGTWFADWTKLGLFLPAAVVLFFLWITGIYLFFLPHYKNWQKRNKNNIEKT